MFKLPGDYPDNFDFVFFTAATNGVSEIWQWYILLQRYINIFMCIYSVCRKKPEMSLSLMGTTLTEYKKITGMELSEFFVVFSFFLSFFLFLEPKQNGNFFK